MEDSDNNPKAWRWWHIKYETIKGRPWKRQPWMSQRRKGKALHNKCRCREDQLLIINVWLTVDKEQSDNCSVSSRRQPGVMIWKEDRGNRTLSSVANTLESWDETSSQTHMNLRLQSNCRHNKKLKSIFLFKHGPYVSFFFFFTIPSSKEWTHVFTSDPGNFSYVVQNDLGLNTHFMSFNSFFFCHWSTSDVTIVCQSRRMEWVKYKYRTE